MKSSPILSRRKFIGATTQAAAWAALYGPKTLHAQGLKSRRPAGRKRIAILATEVRKHSHAQHFIDRYVEGYGWEGRHYHPRVDLVSLYVDQFPEGDLSRDRERRHQTRIYPTIMEALTCGTAQLAVDGVLIIGEHGKYPRNEKGQTLYPRYRFFNETVKTFLATGRAVPVFNDKHLSTAWQECVAMVQTARRMQFPFMAGSSLPVTWRIPQMDFPLNIPLAESVCVGYGGVDSYDFHGLETAQCMSERRLGGEVGIESVQALRGAAVWDRLEKEATTHELFLAALTRSFTVGAASPEYPVSVPALDWMRQRCAEPIGYFYQHRDGFKTRMFLMNGLVSDFTYAGKRSDTGQVQSCQMFLPMPGTVSTTADFFNPLVHHVEEMILQNRPQYPVERTLLTSGMTLFAVESLARGQVPLSTPEMSVIYTAPKESTFWRS